MAEIEVAMNVSELRSEIVKMKAQKSLLRCQLSLGSLKDTASIRKLKKLIARYCTLLSAHCKRVRS